MTLTILITLIQAHVRLIEAQTALIQAITAANPGVSAELWQRFAEDTKPMHDGLMKLYGLLDKLFGGKPAVADVPAAVESAK